MIGHAGTGSDLFRGIRVLEPSNKMAMRLQKIVQPVTQENWPFYILSSLELVDEHEDDATPWGNMNMIVRNWVQTRFTRPIRQLLGLLACCCLFGEDNDQYKKINTRLIRRMRSGMTPELLMERTQHRQPGNVNAQNRHTPYRRATKPQFLHK